MGKNKKLLEPQYITVFILRFCVVVCAVFGISGVYLFYSFDKNLGPTYSHGVSILSRVQAYLPYMVIITALVQAAALCVVVMLITLLWSHKIAGPLVRFRKYLKNIASGKLFKRPLTFRDDDQLHAVALAFSEMIIAQNEASLKSLSLLVEAQKIIAECKALRSQFKADTAEFEGKLKELASIYSSIQDIYTVNKTG